MEFNLKVAAENLLKIAESLEKEALDKTFFICSGCNHTASLTTINDKRKKIASEKNVQTVSPVTVNDKVSCPACNGVMSYEATDESTRYYVEAEGNPPLEVAPPSDTEGLVPPPEEDKKREPKEESPDEGVPAEEIPSPEDIFQPVNAPEPEKVDLGVEGETPEEGAVPGEGEKTEEVLKTPEEEAKTPEGIPTEIPDAPTADKTDEPSADAPPIVEEVVPIEEEKKPKKKKKDIEFPKDDVPKFEKMPKDASDLDYQMAIQKYMF